MPPAVENVVIPMLFCPHIDLYLTFLFGYSQFLNCLVIYCSLVKEVRLQLSFWSITMSQVLSYPCCKSTTTTVEKLHGQEISDKHRWLGTTEFSGVHWACSRTNVYHIFASLEDENSEDYHTFIREQNSLTDEYLRHYTETEALKKFVVDSGSYPSFGCPTILEGAYTFAEKSGGQNGHLLQARSIHDPNPSKLIDIHKLRSSLGTSKGESYESYKFSPDGSLVSLTFSESGGDQLYGRILRLSDQSLLPDEIRGVRTCSWNSVSANY